jgi:hypothetical protein
LRRPKLSTRKFSAWRRRRRRKKNKKGIIIIIIIISVDIFPAIVQTISNCSSKYRRSLQRLQMKAAFETQKVK